MDLFTWCWKSYWPVPQEKRQFQFVLLCTIFCYLNKKTLAFWSNVRHKQEETDGWHGCNCSCDSGVCMLLTFDLLFMIMRARGLLKVHMTWDIMALAQMFSCWLKWSLLLKRNVVSCTVKRLENKPMDGPINHSHKSLLMTKKSGL